MTPERTLACYRQRLAHRQHWCRTRRYQPGTDVQDQTARWTTDPGAGSPGAAAKSGCPRYRPETIRQAVKALVC
ncbi:hypothetical protein [Amycolatopsis silviterrae]|uniref:Uncharacterized protein n=1 Tax=Amycolatopsis silviterrae TaxID=1656914 RepID=A0ABW5HGU1_9PSEU